MAKSGLSSIEHDFQLLETILKVERPTNKQQQKGAAVEA